MSAITQRDRLILALTSCGLHRRAISRLVWPQLAFVEDRWILRDVPYKHGVKRDIALPDWVAADLLTWRKQFRASERIIDCTPTNIYLVIRKHTGAGPRDLHRSGAETMRNAGVPLDQLSITLGHKDIKATLKYLDKA